MTYLGVGKSTLLRHIALREVPVPAHITILFVEQEVCILL
jgi:ATP-binding cassette subfamily F protein 3